MNLFKVNDHRFLIHSSFHLLIYLSHDSFFFFIYLSMSIILIWLTAFLAAARFTHLVLSRLIRLILMIVFSAENDLIFVMKSTRLLLSWIHFISMILRFSYDCFRIITLIINRFLIVVSSYTRQSYKNLLLITSIKRTRASSIFVRIDFSIESTSNSWIIAKGSTVKTLFYLHFTDYQRRIFVMLIKLIKQTM